MKVGLAILTPIYGESTIADEGPFRGCLKGDVWTVAGTVPEGADGGTATIKLSKSDARVLKIVHYE